MKVLGIVYEHDATVCLMEDGEAIQHLALGNFLLAKRAG